MNDTERLNAIRDFVNSILENNGFRGRCTQVIAWTDHVGVCGIDVVIEKAHYSYRLHHWIREKCNAVGYNVTDIRCE